MGTLLFRRLTAGLRHQTLSSRCRRYAASLGFRVCLARMLGGLFCIQTYCNAPQNARAGKLNIFFYCFLLLPWQLWREGLCSGKRSREQEIVVLATLDYTKTLSTMLMLTVISIMACLDIKAQTPSSSSFRSSPDRKRMRRSLSQRRAPARTRRIYPSQVPNGRHILHGLLAHRLSNHVHCRS